MTMKRTTRLALQGSSRILPVSKKYLAEPKKGNMLGTSASPVKLNAATLPLMREQLRTALKGD